VLEYHKNLEIFGDIEEVSMDNYKAYLGNVIYSQDKDTLVVKEKSYILVQDGIVQGIFKDLPEGFPQENIIDWGNNLIIPGFSDMHVHASQFLQRGMGMDKKLLDWLNTYTYPTEAKFQDKEHAKKIYGLFVDELVRQGTLHVNCFSSIHYEASEILFELLLERGLFAFTGKLNMDQNSPEFYLEDTVFKTNMEAAVEIARQLRLRNIGGIIIVDFIDMDTPEHKEEIIAKLEEQFQRDKVKTHILGLTSLGLLEMTRKKMRHTLSTVLEKTCPCCEGKGTILSETTLAFRIKEELQETAQRTMAETILLKVNPKVAALLVGPGGMLLKQLESNLKKEIIIQGKEKLAIDEYTLEPLHGNVDPRYGIPVEEEQLIRITVTEPHGQRSQDGIGRIAGFVIEIEDGASLVGKEILVEITKVFRTYAKAVIVKDYLE
jgi:cytosine/adenosine deaminase-related metal-dependent hydrolase/predicted RNA-binding protein with TRAM domain